MLLSRKLISDNEIEAKQRTMQNIRSVLNTLTTNYCQGLANKGDDLSRRAYHIKGQIMRYAMHIGINFVKLKFPTVTTTMPKLRFPQYLTKGANLDAIVSGIFSRQSFHLIIGYFHDFRTVYITDLDIQWAFTLENTVKMLDESKDLTHTEKSMRYEEVARLQEKFSQLRSKIASDVSTDDALVESIKDKKYLSLWPDGYFSDTKRAFVDSESDWNMTAGGIFKQMQEVCTVGKCVAYLDEVPNANKTPFLAKIQLC